MKNQISFFSFVRLVCLVIFMSLLGMLYWSYVLQEEKLKSIDIRLEAIQNELKNKNVVPNQYVTSAQDMEVGDPNYPNLLVQDAYSAQLLPLLLGKDFTPKGCLRMAIVGAPDTLHPFSPWSQVAEWMGYCQGTAAREKFGYYETLSPDFALKIEERPLDRPDRASFWVHLREDLYWQPLKQEHFPDGVELASMFLHKHKVTAHDFHFFFNAIFNPHVDVPDAVTLRFLLRDIERIDVIDDHTFSVIAKKTKRVDRFGKSTYVLPYATHFYVAQLRPLARFVYQYNSDGTKIAPNDEGADFYRTSSLWAEHFSNHFASRVIVSCGPWVFDGMSDRQIRFRRNSDYYAPHQALYEAMEIYFLESPDAIFRDFVAQKIDLCTVSPQDLVELDQYLMSKEYAVHKQKGIEINRLDYFLRNYTYVAWNQKNVLFQNKKVRQALTLAIDRNRLIRQNLQGKGVVVTGPFFIASEGYNTSVEPYPYDPDEAKRLLAQAGWFDSNADGVLDKMINGTLVPFKFRLAYFVKNPASKANCELIATFLKEVGIECVLQGLDITDLSIACEDKSFDALYLAWGLSSPPEDPRQLWHSEAADQKGSSNLVGFRNKEVDLLIDELQFEHNREARKKLLWKIHEIIYDEMPYTFLFTPTATLVSWNWEHNIFIPKERQDILPGATWEQPSITYSWKY